MNGGSHQPGQQIYRSTDGGNTWTNTYTGPTFAGPRVTACPNTYFACMFPTAVATGGTWAGVSLRR